MEARRQADIQKREAELLEARRQYFEERKTAANKKVQLYASSMDITKRNSTRISPRGDLQITPPPMRPSPQRHTLHRSTYSLDEDLSLASNLGAGGGFGLLAGGGGRSSVGGAVSSSNVSPAPVAGRHATFDANMNLRRSDAGDEPSLLAPKSYYASPPRQAARVSKSNAVRLSQPDLSSILSSSPPTNNYRTPPRRRTQEDRGAAGFKAGAEPEAENARQELLQELERPSTASKWHHRCCVRFAGSGDCGMGRAFY